MPYMTRIVDDLKREGLKVEVTAGWDTRGNPSFAPAGVVCHWTAGPRGTTKRSSLNVVMNGRTGLPGPLCNIYLDRDGVCVVVAAGRANHAGEGGWDGLVGNSSVYGIEAESGGDGDWTEAQYAAYPLLVAALLRGLGRPARRAAGHNEWAPTRKIDIRDWTMTRMRTQIADILARPAGASTQEDDIVASIDDLRSVVETARNQLAEHINSRVNDLAGDTRSRIDGAVETLRAEGDVDRNQLAEWVVAQNGALLAALREAIASGTASSIDAVAVTKAAEAGAKAALKNTTWKVS